MNAPEISVVMATANAAKTVEACLKSLEDQAFFLNTEVIVADCSTDGTDDLMRKEFPRVKLLHFDRPMGLPQLLREALQHAQGHVVVVTEPHCRFASDWLEKLHRAHQSEFDVIGGAVENGRPNGLVNWACYFADYGPFMLPSRRKLSSLLPGNHVSYKRSAIEKELNSIEDGFWKIFFHWDLEQQGVRFLFDPELVAYYVRPGSLASFLRGYYLHGWFFAAMRSKRISSAERSLHLVTTPALPLVLFYRRLRAALANPRHRAKVLLTTPLLAVMVIVWSAGELTGYLLGPSGMPKEVYR
jgi:glycosyltransferase involved in cell wall biosynthesis